MADLQDPAYLQHGEHSSRGDRLIFGSIVASEGVVPGVGGELAVSEDSGGATMSVDVASGTVFIEGDNVAFQGKYHAASDSSTNLAIAASDPTNDRIDLVVAQVRDTFYGDGADEYRREVITGVAGPSPAEPAVPNNAVVLARVDVGAGVAAITDADITDRREFSELNSEMIPATGLAGMVTFTGDNVFNKGDYPWLRAVRVRVVGAGGGGGGGQVGNSSSVSAGGGGGGGAYSESFIPVEDLADAEPITRGEGGAGGSGSAQGSSGGDSSFGTHVVAVGGGGGQSSLTSGTYRAGDGGDGGAAGLGTGQITASGGGGGPSLAMANSNTGFGGAGGSSAFGSGARGMATTTGTNDGQDALLWHGGGGGGGVNPGTSTEAFGGNGGNGVVIVELYA